MQSRKKRAKKTRGKVAHNPQFGVKYSFIEELDLVQLNKYETAPHFIQLTQNLTLDCLLI